MDKITLRQKFEALVALFPELDTDGLFWDSVDKSIAQGMTEKEFVACLISEAKVKIQ